MAVALGRVAGAWFAVCAGTSIATRVHEAARSPRCGDFAAAVKDLGGSFELLERLGFYAWNPNQVPQRRVESVSSIDLELENVLRGLGLAPTRGPPVHSGAWPEAHPPRLVNISELQVPRSFVSLPPRPLRKGVPHAPPPVSVPFVAAQRFSVDLEGIDFILDGPSLSFLGKHEVSKRTAFTAERVRGAILILKSAREQQDLADRAHQFRRWVTGVPMEALGSGQSVWHLQLARIGGFRALLVGEVDAVDSEGRLALVGADRQVSWRTVVFQMIASGCGLYVRGTPVRDQIAQVAARDLQAVMRSLDRLRPGSVAGRFQRIAEALESIHTSMVDLPKLRPYSLSFSPWRGSPSLSRISQWRSLLPPPNVTSRLLPATPVRA
mmetsp:Transcript_39276/g.113556  ORF Transcript_39276/g.113556 Transcript_39276/m.113556 type:complete len:381 (-) Transcript_39276:99-1241(-)